MGSFSSDIHRTILARIDVLLIQLNCIHEIVPFTRLLHFQNNAIHPTTSIQIFYLRVACKARCQMFWGCPGDKQMAVSWFMIKFETPWAPPAQNQDPSKYSAIAGGARMDTAGIDGCTTCPKESSLQIGEADNIACTRRLVFDHGGFFHLYSQVTWPYVHTVTCSFHLSRVLIQMSLWCNVVKQQCDKQPLLILKGQCKSKIKLYA